MIGKVIRSYVKSKTMFKIHYYSLSKLAEQVKIHLIYIVLKFFIYSKNFLLGKIILSKSRDYSALDDPHNCRTA